MAQIDRVQWALRERVKELTCLYGIARVTQLPGISLQDALRGIVELLPPAWQYPHVTCARIVLDNQSYATIDYRASQYLQSAKLLVEGKERGFVEVSYRSVSIASAESPFLQEEQNLIEMVGREVSLLIERRESEERNARLQTQLRHADRLATIGQLAAGVAHEINEPLANILGYAQLARKTPRVPKSTGDDLEKIVRNCLHAREVIQKLLTFARQMPPEKARVNLNRIVADGLYFLDSRCIKAGIEVVRELDSELPDINADASQLHQVVVNLVVNAIQAMPHGGKITMNTRTEDHQACLTIEDTGTGMTPDILNNIFTPFFTTKDVNEGTGLGLAVVHGIVASHGGTISVSSEPGRGSRFELRFPLNGFSEGGTK